MLTTHLQCDPEAPLTHDSRQTPGRPALSTRGRALAAAIVASLFLVAVPAQAQYQLLISNYGGSPANPDNTAAFNSALNACKLGQGGIILFGKGVYRFQSPITVDAAGCSVQGVGQRATSLQFNGQGDFLTIAEYGNTVSDVAFLGSPGWTQGFALVVGGGGGASIGVFRDLLFESVPGAVHVYNSSETRYDNLYIVNPKGPAAFLCDDGGVSKGVFGVRLRNIMIGYNTFGPINSTTDGFVVGNGCNTFALSASGVSGGIPSGGRCISVLPGSSLIVLDDLECDHTLYGAVFDGGNVIQSTNGFYGSTLGGNGVTFTGNFTGNAQFTNNDIRGNSQNGVLLNGGTDIVFTGGVIGNNSQQSHGVFNGITVGSGVSRFTITGVRSGAIDQGSGTPSPHQAFGILVAAGPSNQYLITGNNLTGNFYGGLGDGGTGTNKVVANNLL